jgi:hypothetical protein
MTPSQKDAFLAWAKNEAHGVVCLSGASGLEHDHRIRAGFDLARVLFPKDEDWLGDLWDSLMR